MTQADRNKSILRKYIPAPAVDTVTEWIYKYNFKLKVKKPRATKEGDYMAPHSGRNHVITINKDLNKYAFLITLIHEVAHLVTWEKYKGRVNPHGREWKREYSLLLDHFLKMNHSLLQEGQSEYAEVLFPREISVALREYAQKPSAATCSDLDLARVLRQFDADSGALLLERISVGASFRISSSRSKHSIEVFVKGEKRRTRFKCFHIRTKREYLIHALCKVELV